MTTEKQIEQYLVKQVKSIGGKAVKMVPTYENGIPDRQVLYKGRAVFVELKRPGKKARPLQVQYMRELKKHGFEAVVIDTREGVDDFVRNLLTNTKV